MPGIIFSCRCLKRPEMRSVVFSPFHQDDSFQCWRRLLHRFGEVCQHRQIRTDFAVDVPTELEGREKYMGDVFLATEMRCDLVWIQ